MKREGMENLPGNTLETMLKMMSVDDIEACCRKGPDAVKPAAAAAATAATKKKDQPRRKPRGGRKNGRR